MGMMPITNDLSRCKIWEAAQLAEKNGTLWFEDFWRNICPELKRKSAERSWERLKEKLDKMSIPNRRVPIRDRGASLTDTPMINRILDRPPSQRPIVREVPTRLICRNVGHNFSGGNIGIIFEITSMDLADFWELGDRLHREEIRSREKKLDLIPPSVVTI